MSRSTMLGKQNSLLFQNWCLFRVLRAGQLCHTDMPSSHSLTIKHKPFSTTLSLHFHVALPPALSLLLLRTCLVQGQQCYCDAVKMIFP